MVMSPCFSLSHSLNVCRIHEPLVHNTQDSSAGAAPSFQAAFLEISFVSVMWLTYFLGIFQTTKLRDFIRDAASNCGGGVGLDDS